MRLFTCLLSALILCKNGKTTGEFTPTGPSLHINDGNFSNRDHMKQEPFQYQQQVLDPLSGSAFNLKVQVNDVLHRKQLSKAEVEVYINYTRTNTALTGEDGSVLLHVPYQTGTPITIVAGKDGYIYTLLPCKTNTMPIFSSVTMSLLGLNQGNIWLFEDSVLITGKTSDASSQPIVQFPKSLLNLTDGGNVTSVKAYLTIPKLPSEESFLDTLGIVSTKSGYVSVELSPVAAVSVQLFSGDVELHLSGPIQINLSIPDSCGLQTSNVVPAWFFNRTTGGWMRKGLGTVVSIEGKLVWTFTAPHLGYWIAAPLSSPRGFFGVAISTDFILRHSSFLMVILGGTLVIVICLLVGFLFYYRRPLRDSKIKKIPVMRKDQTTSTCDDEVFDVCSGDPSHPQDGLSQSFTERADNRHNASVISMNNGNIIANPNAVAITMECNELELNTDDDDLTNLTKHIRVPASLTENLFFYNQPVAILHAPAFFHLEEQPEEPQWSKSATLPRAGASNSAATEPLSKDSFTQTLPKGPSATQNQPIETEDSEVLEGSQAATSTNTSRGHFTLPESVSVPGTLNKMGGSRHSVHALAELSKIPSLHPPRAWFVSLDGKPAAEIHYAVSEQHRRRRPVESRETSLDSGVDMSELNQTSVRRAVTLERNVTFVKSTSSSKHATPQ
ncbi:protein FAM171B-like isoform X1 [Larimichthys crocea]|uniref:protein FAM171B-like isoform X1 n=1 Tax=Larimichthys crocea TaxID=215358 RepID=UPI000F5D6B17|nr:protein FAM171B-like isoform X1 [Larimichthys crocea]XP_027138974.1 protein FAM171B-like isoform X1 [Larimichthys crocea]XP_027138979.1 protein FAM171B-like isoform X1 [Larimichthys crocea]XP_027138982.1 protein FAM171B-like isoform X1 [Larimichthys crocea]XP_027138988.1 protein FAM171B-like isoform X1 [Larimichthys crocea]